MNQYRMMPLNENVEEMFIGPFGSSLKNECFVPVDEAFCMVYEQKHAIQKTMNVDTRYVNKEKYNELQRFNVIGGDIIVSCRGTIGETFIVPDDAPMGIMHPSIMKIRLKEGVYNKFYFNKLLTTRLKKHKNEANGSGIKMAISATSLGKELFPVPTLEEQQEIAETLDKLQSIITHRRTQLEKLDLLVKARFVEMFGDSSKYNIEQLKNNVEEMFIGPFGSALKSEYFVDEKDAYCMVYEQKHAIQKTLNLPTRYVDKEKYNELKRFTVLGNDIIISCRGTIGEIYSIPKDAPMGIMHPSIMKIRLNKEKYRNLFFTIMLEQYMQNSMTKAKGSGVKMAVTATELGKEFFIIPSIEEQKTFENFVKQVDKSKATVQKALDEAQLLFDSLMQEYFG